MCQRLPRQQEGLLLLLSRRPPLPRQQRRRPLQRLQCLLRYPPPQMSPPGKQLLHQRQQRRKPLLLLRLPPRPRSCVRPPPLLLPARLLLLPLSAFQLRPLPTLSPHQWQHQRWCRRCSHRRSRGLLKSPQLLPLLLLLPHLLGPGGWGWASSQWPRRSLLPQCHPQPPSLGPLLERKTRRWGRQLHHAPVDQRGRLRTSWP